MEDGVMVLTKVVALMLAISLLPVALNIFIDAWKDSNIYDKVCMFTISVSMISASWFALHCCFM